MNHYNDVFWNLVLNYADNTGLCIILFALANAALITFLSCLLKKDLVIFAVFPCLSVMAMLKNLASLHPRLRIMLRTCSGVIYSSDRYLGVLSRHAGRTFHGSREVADYLFSLTEKEMDKLTDPKMLYEKLFSCMKGTRSFFGYVDQAPEGAFYLCLFLPTAILLILRIRARKTRMESVFLLFLLIIAMMKTAGVVLFLAFFSFSCEVFSLTFTILPNDKKGKEDP